jgi:hypothetical protein
VIVTVVVTHANRLSIPAKSAPIEVSRTRP